MIVRDNNGKIVGQIEHFRDAQGNTVDTVTSSTPTSGLWCS